MRELKYLKISSKIDSLQDIKQLWYGLEEGTSDDDYNEIYNGYSCENVLTYTQEPSRDLSGMLHNSDIQRFYIPKATFSFSYVNADVYSKLIQILNTDHFYVKYYDYEIMQDVVRDMYMTEHSLSRFHNVGSDIKGFIDVEVTFVSRVSYDAYINLKYDLLYETHKYEKTLSGTTGTMGETSIDGETLYKYNGSINIGSSKQNLVISDNHVIISYDDITGVVKYRLYSTTANTSVSATLTYEEYKSVEEV